MSFTRFIYYCSLCGGWAAFVAWGLVQFSGIRTDSPDSFWGTHPAIKDAVIALVLGVLCASAVGAVDALMNSTGGQRFLRVGICLAVGLLGGFLGGLIGGTLYQVLSVPRVFGWILVGASIGASIGIFDLLSALQGSHEIGPAVRKMRNGLAGGALGGFVGGLLFSGVMKLTELAQTVSLELSSLAAGLVILGLCIGLLIGLAQVILREAWVRVEAGFRPGREMMLAKGELTIGRAEACDIGLFGDPGVEKLHARILRKNNRFLLEDNETPGGTYLNDQRVTTATPLKSGDLIRVGRNVLRFGERQKRK